MTLGRALVGAALAVAALDWWAVARGDRRAEYALKPLTLVVLIGAAIALRHGDPTPRFALTLAALALSLAGDVFLMLPKNLFVAGLASFLAAHVCYVAAFNPSAPPLGPTLAAGAGIALAATSLYVRLLRGMRTRGLRSLSIPVGLYVVAVSAMVVSAVATVGRPDWTVARSALAIAGAGLFFVSDGMIGWTRFVDDFRGSRVAIMVTYHLGQAGLVLGLLG